MYDAIHDNKKNLFRRQKRDLFQKHIFSNFLLLITKPDFLFQLNDIPNLYFLLLLLLNMSDAY